MLLVIRCNRNTLKPKLSISLLFISVFAAALVHADTLSEYDFEGFTAGTNSSTGAVVTTAYSNFTFGAGLEAGRVQYQSANLTGNPADYYWQGWDGNMMRTRQQPGAGASTVDGAVTLNSYFSITYTPGGTVSLDSFDFEAAVRSDLSLVPMTANFTLRSSLTGNTNLGGGVASGRVELGEHTGFSVDLSGFAELQNFSSPITFTLYVDNAGAGTTRREVFVDNITLHGVPEPGSMALLGIGGAALFLFRFRRKK